jgi:hypothetical protein
MNKSTLSHLNTACCWTPRVLLSPGPSPYPRTAGARPEAGEATKTTPTTDDISSVCRLNPESGHFGMARGYWSDAQLTDDHCRPPAQSVSTFIEKSIRFGQLIVVQQAG